MTNGIAFQVDIVLLGVKEIPLCLHMVCACLCYTQHSGQWSLFG